MFINFIKLKLKAHELEKENNALYKENKELNSTNEENTKLLESYRLDNKDLYKKLSLAIDIIENFDFRKNNSIATIHKIKEVITSDQTK